ncbi:unnamed protein product [Mycena citricolor]|uniref:Uncharacterized protein n=1 Tax=Mycena citricolor TaxID=2018698 RepID=A0AAD2Q0I4_9AGAR|nr:unnamed protein product [Mycena citricolor]
MASGTNTMAAAPPPTSHTLSRSHRLRLMRSTRKLGALLGETPLVIERDDPGEEFDGGPPAMVPSTSSHASTSTLKRSASSASTMSRTSVGIYVRRHARGHDPANLSISSHHEMDPRPTLVINLPPSHMFDSHRTSWSSSPSTPAESPVLTPATLISAGLTTPTAGDESSARRRQVLAKLSRTLGENVPPELVFPDPKVLDIRASAPAVESAARKPPLRRASTLSAGVYESARPTNQASSAEWAKLKRRKSSVRPSIDSSATERSYQVVSLSRDPAIATGPDAAVPRSWAPGYTMHREEEGWSGEWGGRDVRSMDDVVRGLRGLKLK